MNSSAKKILLLDQETDLADSIRQLLEFQNYQVEVANCVDALKCALGKAQYSCLISHLSSRETNMAVLFRELKLKYPELRQILMTGALYVPDDLAGEFKVIFKPFSIEELIFAIEET